MKNISKVMVNKNLKKIYEYKLIFVKIYFNENNFLVYKFFILIFNFDLYLKYFISIIEI
jgi:hypothetical protein